MKLAPIALLLTACASAPVLQPATLAVPPTIIGRPGELPLHLYARLVVRSCVGDEYEHVISQVERFLVDCDADGQEDCERRACDKLREEWIRRNSPQHAYARPPILPPLKPRKPASWAA